MQSINNTGMTFEEFQAANSKRCKEAWPICDEWTAFDWALAIAGESGELCNLLKKVKRGDFTIDEVRQEILKEIADIITYCDQLNTRLGASTGSELIGKFIEVSQRVGYEPR